MIPNGSESAHNCANGNFICGVVEGFYGKPWTTEQRRKLFKRMRNMGMNTYTYAPKDDSKHRIYWRDLYSVEEADHLTGLIEAAEENCVSFVYALSPGLDMIYSSSKEVTCLKRKLEQVSSFGCKSFALLFDDIEIEMSAPDKEIFQSFANAQVSVTNEVYQHLGQPEKFLFCPTEYCASRAVPNVSSSEYLTTIGSKLLQGIDIMWTGPKVISKRITIKSVQELTKVLNRPPVIWDNIHANDYDQKRLFLGPYDGRSPELIPYLKGVMTNPNCEFEPNYIAMHTLSQWSHSTIDCAKRDLLLSHNPVSADIKLETDGEFSSDEDIPVNVQGRYQPKQALRIALKDWLEEFYDKCSYTKTKMVGVPPPVMLPAGNSIPLQAESMGELPEKTSGGIQNLNELVSQIGMDSFMQPAASAPVNSLLDPPSSSESDSDSVVQTVEPMDCAITPGSTPAQSADGSPVPHAEVCVEIKDVCVAPGDFMQIDSESIVSSCEVTACSIDKFNIDDLAMLVDLFYLPFEHGSHASALLTEFQWLKSNAHIVTSGKSTCATPGEVHGAAEWQSRALMFKEKIVTVLAMTDRLFDVPNKALVQDLYPYVWDVKGLLTLVDTFISWLGANEKYIELFKSGEQEPWVFRGGLLGEFQHYSYSGFQVEHGEFGESRLLPLEGASDLLFTVCPKIPSAQKLLTVRPYTEQDKAAVYEICRRTCDDGMDGTDIFPHHPDLIGDKLVDALLTISPYYCFVVEDDIGVCGYVLSALDYRDMYNTAEVTMWPSLRKKYPKPDKTEGLTPAEEIICSLYNQRPSLPESVFTRHPSVIRMDMLPDRIAADVDAPRRALASAVAAMKVNGSHGMFTEINIGDHNTVDVYKKYAFYEVPLESPREDTLIYGRVF